MCTAAGIWVCACVVCVSCVLGARPKVHIGSLPLGLSSLLFEARSLLNLELTFWLRVATCEAPGFACVQPRGLGPQAQATMPTVYQVLSMLTRQHTVHSVTFFLRLHTKCLLQGHLHGYLLNAFRKNASKMFGVRYCLKNKWTEDSDTLPKQGIIRYYFLSWELCYKPSERPFIGNSST